MATWSIASESKPSVGTKLQAVLRCAVEKSHTLEATLRLPLGSKRQQNVTRDSGAACGAFAKKAPVSSPCQEHVVHSHTTNTKEKFIDAFRERPNVCCFDLNAPPAGRSSAGLYALQPRAARFAFFSWSQNRAYSLRPTAPRCQSFSTLV